MAENYQDREFLEFLVKSIVSNPDKVSVERTVDERGVLLTLKLEPADMGYVIGRKGQTAQAIRTLLKIIGAKNNARVNLKIYEPEGMRSENRAPRASRPTNNTDTLDLDASSIDELSI